MSLPVVWSQFVAAEATPISRRTRLADRLLQLAHSFSKAHLAARGLPHLSCDDNLPGRASVAAAAAVGMTAISHLVCLFCVTAGQNGENLGSDEEQIVLFVYLLYDIANNKVRVKTYNDDWTIPST